MAGSRKGRVFWRRRVLEQAESGLTQVAYCTERGLATKTFQRWRTKLSLELQLEELPSVVEIVLDEPTPAAQPTSVRDLELLIGGDCSLFFAPGTPPDYLADLVLALRQRGAC